MENKESTSLHPQESRRQKHETDSGNDESSKEILQKEKVIDVGNEHHHSADANGSSTSPHEADAGNDAVENTGPEPGEGKNDAPDTSGEDG